MTNWDWLENKHDIRKIYKIEKKLFNHFFDLFLTVIVSNKIMWPLESVIKEFTVLKIFFSNSIPASDHLYGCIMEELWVTVYSGFMKDFVSFTMKNTHRFDIPFIDADLLLFKHAICKLLPVKFSQELLQTYLLIS